MDKSLFNLFNFVLIILWVVFPVLIRGSSSVPPLPLQPEPPPRLPLPTATSPQSSLHRSSSLPPLSLLSLSSSNNSPSPSLSPTPSHSSKHATVIFTPTTAVKPPEMTHEVNNFPPRFNQSSYHASMPESSERGSLVVQVYATDADKKGTAASMIHYLLLTSDPHFTISSETGIIYLAEPLDYEKSSKHHLIVAASDEGSPLLTSTCQVWVDVIDVNDNGPKFSKTSYTAVISEQSPVNMFVTKVTAIDADSSDALEDKLRYSIEDGNGSENTFTLDPITGILRTRTTPFIYTDFKLNISVTDGRNFDYTSVNVRILFANKERPVFLRTLYTASVTDTAPVGTKIISVEAFDNDDGVYAEVTYSILSSYLLRWFKIDSKTGDITTVSHIDREKHESFSLTVMAKDGGHRIGLTIVKIIVAGANDNPPKFLIDKYEAAICSNISINENILPVIAYDKDKRLRGSKKDIRYSIHHIGLPESSGRQSTSATSSSPFAIRKNKGYIYVASNLSHSVGSVYTFQVKARNSNYESVVPVTIKINGPCQMEKDLVASFDASVSEMAKVDSVITTINITNLENLELTLITSNPESNKFKLGEQGKIYLTEPLDSEDTSLYILVFRVFDKTTFSIRYLNVVIEVIDTNDNVPIFDSDPYWIEVSEDQEVGSPIGRIHAWDGDVAESQRPIFYKLKRGKRKNGQLSAGSSHGGEYFDLDQETGFLNLRRPLDRETDEWHNLTAIITDGKFTNKTSIHIRVIDINDNPPKFINDKVTASVREGSPVGMIVTSIEATDADIGGSKSLRYFITSGDPLNHFKIRDNGELIVNKRLDRKKRGLYEMEVLVSDTKYFATAQVSVEVLESVGPICRKSEYVEIVSEDIELGTNILTVEAESKDDNEDKPITGVKLFYSLFSNENGLVTRSNDDSDDSGELPFALDSKTGVLTVVAPLDREKKATYLLLAKVHDDKERENMCSSTIEIIVSDINDNAPKFSSSVYRYNLAEDIQPGKIVGKVQAYDPDQGKNGEFRYTLQDYLENIEEDDDEKTFTIDEVTGLIRLNKPLDREEIESYNLTVKAIDSGLPSLSSSTQILIQIEDVNDNPPEFTQKSYQVSVYENVTVGVQLIKVEATSRDIGINADITYTIENGNINHSFTIDGNTGIISIAKSLDREIVNNYVLTIKAQDKGLPPLHSLSEVNITILDCNDNGPVCESYKYVKTVPEDVEMGTILLKVEAYDPDEGANSQLFYNLSLDSIDLDSGKEEDDPGFLPFSIDPKEGVLRTAGALDREKKANYLLVAHVHDAHERSRLCTSSIEITVDDINDNPPHFDRNEHIFYIAEDAKMESIVGRVQAYDKDVGINGQVRYFLDQISVTSENYADDSGNSNSDNDEDESPFMIEETSGVIKLNKPLDREKIESYNLSVKAVDSGVPSLSTSQVIVINVLDVNDNAPEFASNYYKASVTENATIGTKVTQVVATSKDTGINAEISYTIKTGNQDNCFTVHPKTGIISVVKPVDRESIAEYILIVTAQDAGQPPLSSEVEVNITIDDVNDNAPLFNQTSYSEVIREDAHVGEKIIQKIASDPDTGDNGRINYYFSASNSLGPGGEMLYHQTKYKEFEIEPKTGIITVASPLDREMISSYIMEVIAVDNGVPPLSSSTLITIEISDVNDNPPKFDQLNYTLYIQESKKVGEIVEKFTLTDSDSRVNSGPFNLEIVEGNQDGCFGIGKSGEPTLTVSQPLNHSRQSIYQLMICATDSGTPPMSSNAWVTIIILEESRFAPTIATPMVISVNTFSDPFPGGILTKINASDGDPHDKLFYELISEEDKEAFTLEEDGTLIALRGIALGSHSVNVSVSDGKFTTYGLVEIEISRVTEDALTKSVQIVVESLSAKDFLAKHKKHFDKALRSIFNVRVRDIFHISIQPIKEEKQYQKQHHHRRRRSMEPNLEILFAIHKTSSNKNNPSDFYPASFIRKKLSENKSSIEKQSHLKIISINQDECETRRIIEKSDQNQSFCSNGHCREDVILDESHLDSYPMEKSIFVSPRHEKFVYCECNQGFGGDSCEVMVNECGRSVSPCPFFKECRPSFGSDPGYFCECPIGKTGPACNQFTNVIQINSNINSKNVKLCHNQNGGDPSQCAQQGNSVTFYGTSYARYKLIRSNIRKVSMRLKTLLSRATIMYSLGNRGYSILELAGGNIQFRFDCGSGEGLIRVEQVFLNDGQWHEVSVDRKGSSVSILVDSKYHGVGQAPGLNEKLANFESNDIYFGAEVKPRPTLIGGEDVKHGFIGCLDNISLDDSTLPLYMSGSSSSSSLAPLVAHLKRVANVKFGSCDLPLVRPAATTHCECLNGGACSLSVNGSYICLCPDNWRGVRCEIEYRQSCHPNPCQPGATCIPSTASINGFICLCPVDETSSSTLCVNYNPISVSSSNDRAFIWDDLILPGIFVIVMIFSCCVCLFCRCCFNRRSTKTGHRSNNRAPTNVYRSGLEGNEFLLDSCNAFPDNSVNMKRFSKLSGVESSALLGHGPFSTEPLPNHHFHQALQQATNGTGTTTTSAVTAIVGGGGVGVTVPGLITNRPNSFHETMNNFDDIVRTPTNDGAVSCGESRPNKKRSIPKNSPIVVPTSPYVETESSHHLTTPNESKIQNRYHWDCYDLEEVNNKPMGNDLGQVSMNEVPDGCESNSDNSQDELLSSEDLARSNANKSGSGSTIAFHQPDVVAANSCESVPIQREDETNGYDGDVDDTRNCKDFDDSLEVTNVGVKSSRLSTNLTDAISGIDFMDRSLPTSPIKYVTHPDEYLPVYHSTPSSDTVCNGNNHEDDTENEMSWMSQPIGASSCVDGGLRRKRERRLTNSYDQDSQYREMEKETNNIAVIKSDNRRQSTFV